MAHTHMIVAELGLDVTQVLTAENMSGIKALLKPRNDEELLTSYLEFMAKQVNDQLSHLGYDDLDVKVYSLNNSDKAEDKQIVSQQKNENDVKITETDEKIVRALKFLYKKISKKDLDTSQLLAAISVSNKLSTETSLEYLKELSGIPSNWSVSFATLKDTLSSMATYNFNNIQSVVLGKEIFELEEDINE